MFNAALVNGPFDDPGVYLEMKYRRRALLFDLGELHALPPRNILKISHVCVSHTHMDHFVGFDHLVRICLGRDRTIKLFGPPGFINQIQGRLNAYTWNLIADYTNDFILVVTEIHPEGCMKTAKFSCKNSFQAEGEADRENFPEMLIDERLFSVKGVFLDHKIPCLAFCAEEKQRINIRKDALQAMGLPVGPWLNDFKDRLADNYPSDYPIRIRGKNEGGSGDEKQIPLGVLKERLVKITPGQKIAYVTDVLYSEANIAAIVALARNADILFIEAAFSHDDSDQALKKYHLTARQAGTIARQAGVKRMIPFHFSPKYTGFENILRTEAERAFKGL